LFGNRIYSVGFKFDTLKINGHIKRIKEGINKISKRGSIIKAGNKITFSTNDGEEVDFITFGSFFNVYVRSNVEKVSGICSQQFIKSKFFKHIHQGKIIKFRHKKCPKKMKYHRICQRRNLKGNALKECVSDLCNGLSKKIENKIINNNKKEYKKN